MARPLFVSVLAILGLCSVSAAPPGGTIEADEQFVENLAAFARVYGYVRFFHPSDEVAAIEWDKFAVLGAERMREASAASSLRDALQEIFAPLGSTGLRIVDATAPPLTESAAAVPAGQRLIYWQHHGVELSSQSNIYKSRRVMFDGEPRQPLFKDPPSRGAVEKPVGAGLRLQLPLVLTVSAEDKTPPADAAKFEALKSRLATLELANLGPEDWRLRIAGAIIAWNVFQHFHPYLDSTGVKWEDALRPALRRTLSDRTRSEYHATLSEMVAKLQDGHGYVYGRGTDVGGIPIRVAFVEDQLVITGADPEAPLRKGDVLLSIDGTPVRDILADRERYVSGSPHLRRFRALNQFGEGALASTMRVEWLRGGERLSAEYQRTRDRRFFFFNPIGEFEFPTIAEVRPGIFYVNLPSTTKAELAEKLPALAAARGVIFDQRWDGRNRSMKPEERVTPHQQVIPHLIGQAIQASPMRTPQVTLPDREGWTYRESTWPVAPKSPRIRGRVVFINEPSVVSYGETCMAMIADYKLATLVGAPTAGCNGNANYILLPGGFRIMWTGMEVIKHDRSPFYGVGFVPDFPVSRTLNAIREGRDEYLEQAIAVIEKDLRSD